MTERAPKTARQRNADRIARAARMLGGIALDADRDKKLRDVLAETHETAADWVRRMIDEQHRKIVDRRQCLPPASQN